MRLYIFGCIICLAAITVVGCRQSESTAITGTYTTQISHANLPANPEMIGTWEITFNDQGKYSLRREQLLIIQGEYSFSDDTLRVAKEVGMGACTSSEPGIYRVTSIPTGLKLQLVGDPCQGRALVLAMFPLTRKGS